jgi:hypothetical protein
MGQGWEGEGEAEAEDGKENRMNDPEGQADGVLNRSGGRRSGGGIAYGISSH